MDTNSLTYRTMKNISYNFIGYIWPMIFALFITPLIVFRLGVNQYGIYIFFNSIISFFGLLDFGLGTAFIKHLSSYYGKKDFEGMQRLVHSGNTLFLIVSSVGLLISIFLMFGGSIIAHTSWAAYAKYSNLFLIGGAIFFINTIDLSYSGILTALQRFDIVNKIGIATITVSSLSTLAVVLAGGSLQMIFIVQLLITIFFTFIVIYQAQKIVPNATIRLGWNTLEIKRCFNFGLITSISNIASTALASLDRIIIPFFGGPSNLTYYSLPGNITQKIPGIANSLSTTMFPTTSELDGAEEKERIERLYIRSMRLITIISAALTITVIAFAYKILLFWLNVDFARNSTYILIILAFTNFILALYGPLYNFLLGLGKLKFLTYFSVLMAIVNSILLIVLLPRYGVPGAAWAYLLSLAPVIYMFYYTEKKYLILSGRSLYYWNLFIRIGIVCLIIWLLDVYLFSYIVLNLALVLVMGGVSLLLFIILYKAFGFFEKEDWQDFEYFFIKAKNRIYKK